MISPFLVLLIFFALTLIAIGSYRFLFHKPELPEFNHPVQYIENGVGNAWNFYAPALAALAIAGICIVILLSIGI